MLLDELPEPLDTWAGKDATPDDGKTWWLYNYGVASASTLPFERAILSFFTWDTKFENWWTMPAFYTSKLINAGVTIAVVPDFSFYTDQERVCHLWNAYRAQWLGRYFQEAGLKVIPRIQGCDKGSLKYNLLGVPKNPPVAITSQQNINTPKDRADMMDWFPQSVAEVNPGTLIVYGSPVIRKMMTQMDLPKGMRVIHLDNYVAKRRGVVFDKKEGLAGVKSGNRKRNRFEAQDKAKEAEEE